MSDAPSSSRTRAGRLLERFELLDELPHVTGGRLFRARDLAFAEIVGIKQLGTGCGLPPGERHQFEETVRHLQCLPHPNLVRIYSLDTTSGVLVQEWVEGISLLDLLRRRRELRAPEALRLLESLPATLDFLATEAVPAPRPLLGKIFVQCATNAAVDTLATTPVDEWPAFVLKLNPLSLRGLVALPENDDSTKTVIADPRQPTEISENYGPREFARLLYELLGGRVRELDARRYVPIGALREAGNAVIRRTLLSMPPNDCQSLWNDLIEAQPELFRPASSPATATIPGNDPLQIPGPLLTAVQPGKLLRLEPHLSGAPPIHLVARSHFAIGRSSQHADYLARVLPENEANNALTNRLSRVHTRLERTAEGLFIGDGNGQGPSLNGTFLDGQALMPNPLSPLTDRSLLRLGEEYSLELIPVFHTLLRILPIANGDAWNGPPKTEPERPYGAIVCVPTRGQIAARQAAWIFTQAGFGLDGTQRLVWDTRGRSDSPASFHYHRGCFWLRNRSLPESALTCQGIALARQTVAPLATGQTIQMGAHSFTVRID